MKSILIKIGNLKEDYNFDKKKYCLPLLWYTGGIFPIVLNTNNLLQCM